MYASPLTNKLQLPLGKRNQQDCVMLETRKPVYLHGRGQISWVRIEGEGPIPMGHGPGESCIVKSSLLLEKQHNWVYMSLTVQHWVGPEGRWLCEGGLQSEGKPRGGRGGQWGSGCCPLKLWGSTFTPVAFESPASLVQERASLFETLYMYIYPGTLSIWKESTAES